MPGRFPLSVELLAEAMVGFLLFDLRTGESAIIIEDTYLERPQASSSKESTIVIANQRRRRIDAHT